ncbi:amino acid permease [Emcibacter sp.]|uniref:amino acid permease n=1 Tax=Emcibacter sp. TaxID=1979954 RepID=UPI003A92508A
MQGNQGFRGRLYLRKSVSRIQHEANNHGLKRHLGKFNLLLLGVGCIIGAGIYVMSGNAAANFAGPGVVFSFVLAGTACGFTALCYAELASTLPVSGSSYTYCYTSIGEIFAWSLGWLLMLEYGLAASALSVGLSGYISSLCAQFGFDIPASLASATVQAASHDGISDFQLTGGFNFLAVVMIALVTLVLVVGISTSSLVNNILVVIKVSVLTGFVIIAFDAVEPANYVPFIPENEGGFKYGWEGILRASSTLFFAYLGFETVSTAASEARNPQKDMPFGIVGALIFCTIIYMCVVVIMIGVVPFRELGVPDPIALVVDRLGKPEFAALIKIGAIAGLASVLLVNAYGQSRISFAMSRDGLLPPIFSRLHEKFRTPMYGTIILGTISAVAAGLFPITLLADFVSLGTAFAFSIVCLSTMWLRTIEPDLERPFRVPLGGIWYKGIWLGYVPMIGILLCLVMIGPVILDIFLKAFYGDIIPAIFLGFYILLGVYVYMSFGHRNSTLGKGEEVEAR